MALSDNMREALAFVPDDWGPWPKRCYALTAATWKALERRGLVQVELFDNPRGLGRESQVRKTEAGRSVFTA